MIRNRRQLLILAALVAVLAAVLWTMYGPSSSAQAPAAAPRVASRRASGADAPLPTAEGVRLGSLEASRERPSESTRNPFRFGARPAAPGAGRTAAAEPAPVLTLKPAEPQAPAGPPPPPPITLKFIGVVEKADGTRLAVLSAGEGRAPIHGKEGDIIDGRYRILKIGTESIELAYLDGRGRQTIRLTGQ